MSVSDVIVSRATKGMFGIESELGIIDSLILKYPFFRRFVKFVFGIEKAPCYECYKLLNKRDLG